jgi:hypothetical protein
MLAHSVVILGPNQDLRCIWLNFTTDPADTESTGTGSFVPTILSPALDALRLSLSAQVDVDGQCLDGKMASASVLNLTALECLLQGNHYSWASGVF